MWGSMQHAEDVAVVYKNVRSFYNRAALNPMNKDLKICSGFIMLTAVAQGFFIPVHAAFFPRNTNMLIGSYVLDFGHFFNMWVLTKDKSVVVMYQKKN